MTKSLSKTNQEEKIPKIKNMKDWNRLADKLDQEEKMKPTDFVSQEWAEIEEILFNLHIRYCPLVETKDSQIKQSDCNQVKEMLKDKIKELLSQSYQSGWEEAIKKVGEVIRKNEWPDGFIDMYGDELIQKLTAIRKENQHD